MEELTISTKYQVVIPKRIRSSMGLKPGQKVQLIEYAGRIEIIPVRSVADARGFLKGIDTSIDREEDRE
jgi:AbrB family looped-hinge helix DNA binding protein